MIKFDVRIPAENAEDAAQTAEAVETNDDEKPAGQSEKDTTSKKSKQKKQDPSVENPAPKKRMKASDFGVEVPKFEKFHAA